MPATPQRRWLLLRCRAASSTPLPPASTGHPSPTTAEFQPAPHLPQKPTHARTRQASETGADTQRTSSKRRSARRPRGCWRGAWATTAGRERRRHEQEDVAVDEAVDGKGRSAGEARSAATHAICCGSRRAGFDWGGFPPLGSERRAPYPLLSQVGEGASRAAHVLFDMSCGFKQNRARDKN